MTMNKLTAISLVCLHQSKGFTPSQSHQRKHGSQSPNTAVSKRFQWHLHYNPNDDNAESTLLEDVNVPPFSEYETSSSRKRRMEMARKLHKMFYSESSTPTDNNNPLLLPDTNNSNPSPKIAYGSSLIRNLPALTPADLSQITSTEQTAILPGYQYVFNIHSPEHTHMFHSILSNPSSNRFFAVLASQEGYTEPQMATLMRITDHRFQDEDGRIVLAVQAMDRCRVVQMAEHALYVTGDFQIWPEIELVRERLGGAFPGLLQSGTVEDKGMEQEEEIVQSTVNPNSVVQAAMAACAAESYRCRNFEYTPIHLTQKPKGPSVTEAIQPQPNDSKATELIKEGISKQQDAESKYETDYLKVIELVSYDAIAYRSLIDAGAVYGQAIKNYWNNSLEEQQQEQESKGLTQEEELFAALANSAALEFKSASFTIDSKTTNQDNEYLPSFSTVANSPSNDAIQMMEYHLWLSLDELIRLLNKVASAPVPLSSQLMALLPKRSDWPKEFVLEDYAKSMLSHTGPMVRIDDITKETNGYSPLRRALRLSHSVWLLLDGLAVTGSDPPPPTRAEVLGMDSIFERLKVAKGVLDGVNGVLRRLIPHIRDGKGDGGK